MTEQIGCVYGPEQKVAKRQSVTLSAGEMKLTILARRTKNDGGETFVTTTDAKTKKATRGMTVKYRDVRPRGHGTGQADAGRGEGRLEEA